MKLCAFTLMELMVGMILTGIVVAFAYGGYSLFSTQYAAFREIKKELTVKTQLHYALENDFNASTKISSENTNIHFYKDNQQIIYEFGDSLVVRKMNDQCDSFPVACSGLKASFIGQGAVLDSLSFSAVISGSPTVFTYYKQYSAEILLSEEIRDLKP